MVAASAFVRRCLGTALGAWAVYLSLGDALANEQRPPSARIAVVGQRLFAINCAHCHGDDARGDEGPSLYDLRKSDARIGRIIREGIKGEMPAFGQKLSEDDVAALIQFLRTLSSP